MSESFFSDRKDDEITAKDEAIGASGLQTLIKKGTLLSTTVCEVTLEPANTFGKDGNAAHFKVMHHVTEKGEFKDHQVPQKLKIFDYNIKVRDKARELLLTYDKLGSGNILKKLKEVGAKKVLENDAFIIRELCGTDLVAEMNLWEMQRNVQNDQGTWVPGFNKDGSKLMREDNNVKSIFPKDHITTAIEDQIIIERAQNDPASPTAPSPQEDAFNNAIEDDIPF